MSSVSRGTGSQIPLRGADAGIVRRLQTSLLQEAREQSSFKKQDPVKVMRTAIPNASTSLQQEATENSPMVVQAALDKAELLESGRICFRSSGLQFWGLCAWRDEDCFVGLFKTSSSTGSYSS